MLCPMKFIDYNRAKTEWECEKEKCQWWREGGCAIHILGDINFQLYRIANKLEDHG